MKTTSANRISSAKTWVFLRRLVLIGSLNLSTSNLWLSNQHISWYCFCAKFFGAITNMILQRIAKIRIRWKHHFDLYLVYLFLLNVSLSCSIQENRMQRKQNHYTVNLHTSQEKVSTNRATLFILFQHISSNIVMEIDLVLVLA